MKRVSDYRCKRKKKHELSEMLTCLIAGYVNGRTSVERALFWCKDNITFLKKHMKLKGGIPSEATISRMMNGIDELEFAFVFMEWVAEILKEHGIHIIIDGKALRGATEKIKGGKPPYVLNAIDAATELVLAQLPIDEKTNEITAIPKLLELLDIQDNLFTIDAIGTQKKIEEMIVDNGGHFVLQVKKNRPALYEDIIASFETIEQEQNAVPEEKTKAMEPYVKKTERWQSVEKNRERIEYRDVLVCKDSTILSTVREHEEKYIRTIGCITQVRVPIEKDSDGNELTVSKAEFIKNGSVRKPRPATGDGMADDIQKTGMISDLEISAEKMAKYKRRHWKIENNLHHVLDDAFREDRSTAGGSKNNLALVRKFAYNVLRLMIIQEHSDWGIQRTMDYFGSHPEMTVKYIFKDLVSMY